MTAPGDAGAKLQDLYDAEINFAIETFWDAGFRARLGDPMNGWTAEGHFPTLAEAADWLVAEANHAPSPTYSTTEKPTPWPPLKLLPPTPEQRAAGDRHTIETAAAERTDQRPAED